MFEWLTGNFIGGTLFGMNIGAWIVIGIVCYFERDRAHKQDSKDKRIKNCTSTGDGRRGFQ